MKYLIILLLLSSTLNAQEVYDTYESALSEKSYDLKVSEKEIYAVLPSSHRGEIVMYHSNVTYKRFEEAMNEAKSKYKEWNQTAIDNNVTELIKEVETKKRLLLNLVFMYGNKWRFATTTAKFTFYVDDNNRFLVFSNKFDIKATDNEYITHGGFQLIFDSVEAIDEFMNKYNTQAPIKVLEAKKSKESLFE